MKKITQFVLLVLLAVLATGCATPYMTDRGRDVADVFTATVGVGGGAKGRVGPVRAGLFLGLDKAGLRGGEFHNDMIMDVVDGMVPGVIDLDLTLSSMESFILNKSRRGVCAARGKYQMAGGVLGLSMSIWSPTKILGNAPAHKSWRQHLPYYTQIEAAVGVGGTLRLGFNPGELLDFLLGWTTIDIFSDDIEWKKSKSNRADGGDS